MLRVGSIGLGGISEGVHIPGILECPDLELTALCDIDPERLKERREKYGIPEDHCFTDYHDLIDCPDVDIVDISTPNDVHAEIALYACKAGKPYGVEKPVTLNEAQAQELYDATKEAGIPSMIYFSYRYKAAARYMKKLIEEGKLGRIYHINAQYFQAWGLPDRDCPLVWRFIKSRTGSGALGDLGCHIMDLAQFVTGEKYVKLVAHNKNYVSSRRLTADPDAPKGTSDVDDHSDVLVETESGTSCAFEISRMASGRGNYQRMEIYGDQGAFLYKLDENGDNVDEVWFCDENSEDRKYVLLEIPEEFKVKQMCCYANQMTGNGDGWNADIEEGLKSQKLMDAVLLSAEEGRWVEL